MRSASLQGLKRPSRRLQRVHARSRGPAAIRGVEKVAHDHIQLRPETSEGSARAGPLEISSVMSRSVSSNSM